MNKRSFRLKFLLLALGLIFISPCFVFANTEGQIESFYVDQHYDVSSRAEVRCVLEKISQRAYFYVDNKWLEGLDSKKIKEVEKNISSIAKEFDENIYPKLTSFYGREWSPGIDNDKRITIVFHEMRNSAAGYFREIDEYSKLQNSQSNEREMVYLNTEMIFSPILKSYLAHEFTHLITFNQKNRLRGIEEDRWLNEARADYSPTYLGYDNPYQGSNLEQRVKSFLGSPNDSLVEWQNQKKDYGVANIFIQYLVGRYGNKILADSLKSEFSGIQSINYALKKNNCQENFKQIFKDWLVAVYANNCSFGGKYCYKNENLKGLKVMPLLTILPSTSEAKLNLGYSIKEWSGHWYRIMGNAGNLEIEIRKIFNLPLEMEYLLCQNNNSCQIGEFTDNNGVLEKSISGFGGKYSSITLMPFLTVKESQFAENEPSYNFVMSISVSKTEEEKNKELINNLLAQIAELKAKIAAVKKKIALIMEKRNKGKKECLISNNLYFGLRSKEVFCLQSILARDNSIYPEGLVTGFFGKLTRQAVIRFQEKYSNLVLKPIGLAKGTGFVGPLTRKAIQKVFGAGY